MSGKYFPSKKVVVNPGVRWKYFHYSIQRWLFFRWRFLRCFAWRIRINKLRFDFKKRETTIIDCYGQRWQFFGWLKCTGNTATKHNLPSSKVMILQIMKMHWKLPLSIICHYQRWQLFRWQFFGWWKCTGKFTNYLLPLSRVTIIQVTILQMMKMHC